MENNLWNYQGGPLQNAALEERGERLVRLPDGRMGSVAELVQVLTKGNTFRPADLQMMVRRQGAQNGNLG